MGTIWERVDFIVPFLCSFNTLLIVEWRDGGHYVSLNCTRTQHQAPESSYILFIFVGLLLFFPIYAFSHSARVYRSQGSLALISYTRETSQVIASPMISIEMPVANLPQSLAEYPTVNLDCRGSVLLPM